MLVEPTTKDNRNDANRIDGALDEVIDLDIKLRNWYNQLVPDLQYNPAAPSTIHVLQ